MFTHRFPWGGLTVKQDLMHPQTINADTEQELNMRHSAQTQSHECVFSAAPTMCTESTWAQVTSPSLEQNDARANRPSVTFAHRLLLLHFQLCCYCKSSLVVAVTFHVSSRCSVSSGVSVNIFYSVCKRADAHVKKERCLLLLDGQRTYIPRKVQTNAANQFHT